MIQRLRSSFAAKLLALELGSIVAVAVALAAVFVAVRVTQTRELERNVAQTNVNSLTGDLEQAGAGAMSLSARLATYAPLANRFGAAATSGVILDSEAQTLDSSQTLVLLDASGQALLARRGVLGGGGAPSTLDPSPWNHPGALDRLAAGSLPAGGVIEPAGDRLEVHGLATVRLPAGAVGYVLDAVDVQGLLAAATPSGSAVRYSVLYDGVRRATTLAGASPAPPAQVYEGRTLTASFAIYPTAGRTWAGFYRVDPQDARVLLAADLDDGVFAAQNLNDLLAAFFSVGILATVLGLLAVLFAHRVAIRPLTELGAGAARLGEGDFGTQVAVSSSDDFGRLAESFNAMAAHIRESTQKLEQQRAHLDASLAALGAVSRALTTTTAGPSALRGAVLDAALEITGAGAAAMFGGAERPEARLSVQSALGLPAGAAGEIARLPAFIDALERGGGEFSLAGGPAGFTAWSGLVVPMVYQGRAVGALAAFDPGSLAGVDADALSVLANQATVALRNSEMFQRERETVLRLQELDAMKSDFLATIQHELRTPLTAIIGMTDLLDMAWTGYSEEQKLQMLNDVQVAAKSLYEVVETILDYSMIESDRLRLDIGPAPLRPALEAAVDDLGPSIRRQKATVQLDVPRSLLVAADPRRLAQVLRALLDNAVKFSPEGGRVKVQAEKGEGEVSVRIIDRGVGIAAEHQERIFERFFQVDGGATRRHGGTGMGLALARRLVELHHGRLLVESEPGRGSTFTVVLPAASL